MQAAVAWAKWRLKTANLRLSKSDTDTHGTKVLSLYFPHACLVHGRSWPRNSSLDLHAGTLLHEPVLFGHHPRLSRSSRSRPAG